MASDAEMLSALLMKVMDSFHLSNIADNVRKWFQENPGKKPSVQLPVVECTLDQVRSTVKQLLLNYPLRRLNPDLVLLYFRKLAGGMNASLVDEWTSFGITIAEAGSDVSPLKIVDVVDCSTNKFKLDSTVTAGPEDDLWILMVLGSIFYSSVSAAEHGIAIPLKTEILEQLRTAGFETSKLRQFWKINQTLTCKDSYKIMIAAFDMFFFKFPHHELFTARAVTSISRFQGFGGYQALHNLSHLINKNIRECQKWMLTSQLQKEYLSITEAIKELDQPYSYIPYIMGLQLYEVAPYPVSASPNLYVFINVVRATLNDWDARFARIPEQSVALNVIINAFVFAHILAPGEERLDGLPEGTDYVEWARWFFSNHSSFLHSCMNIPPPKALMQKFSRTWSAFRQDPPGTIGNLLYKFKLNTT